MKEMYVCEICGEIYTDAEKALLCETRGNATEYTIGDILLYADCDLWGGSHNIGRVIKIGYAPKTHEPIYRTKSIGMAIDTATNYVYFTPVSDNWSTCACFVIEKISVEHFPFRYPNLSL